MKILYVSPDQNDASLSQVPSTAGAGVVLRNATNLGEAAHWIFSNLDLAAVILDAEFGLPQCASFVKNLRGRGLSVPLILMASEEGSWMEALSLRPDDCIVQKDVLLSDLEGAVRRAVYRARPSAAFAVLARQVVDIHRQLDRWDREHDLRIESGDLRAAQTALQEQLTRTEAALDQSTTRQTEASQNAVRREEELLCLLREEAERRTTIARLLEEEQRARNEAHDTLKRERLTTAEQVARLREESTVLEQHLASAEAERRDLEKRHAVASAVERTQFAEREARLIAELANSIRIKDALDRQIAERHATCESLQQELESKNAMLERLGQRERELLCLLHEEAERRTATARLLEDEQRARYEADDTLKRERLTTAEQVARLREESTVLEQRLASAEVERRELEQRHAAASAAERTQFAQREARLTAELANSVRTKDALDRQIAELHATCKSLQQELESKNATVERLGQREHELLCLLHEEAESRTAIARLLEDEQRARNEADDTLKRERLTTAGQIARLREESTVLEQRLASAEVERRDLEARHASASAAERAQFAEREARLIAELANNIRVKDALDRQIADNHATCESLQRELESKNGMLERLGQRERELHTLLADVTNSRDALVHEVATSESSLRAAEHRAREQRVAALNERTELEARVADERHRRAALERELQDTRSAAAETRHQLLDKIDVLAAERLREMTVLSDQLAQERRDYHVSVNTLQERVGQLEIERDTLANNFRTHRTVSEEAASRLADERDTLQRAFEEIQQRIDHEFDDYPLPLCRATRAGVVTGANRAFGALLGCPSADAKRRLNLASELFDSSNELAWLVERGVSSEDAPSVECTRRKVDGTRLMLRLRAVPAPDAIHIVVEDLTSNWMLQERLNRAQRMEAVGRMSAEVALTCVNFLRDATEHGSRLLAMVGDGSEARRSGEHMLGEVDRVATSLRQLADYADDQAASLDPVDLHQVLHDLEPILQELAGDEVHVVLPERPPREVPPFTVDVTAQRVERLLINLARYSRGRIPSGGRMVFDVASTTVDGPFVAKYPNVRQGPHVLLTVTQARDGNGLVPSGGAQASTVEGNDDLSALHGLVRHCGGHLGMDTDTTGEMKIKIHLPLRAA